MNGVVFKHGVRRSSRSLSPLLGGGYLQSRAADRGWLCDLDLGEGITAYLRNQQVPKTTQFHDWLIESEPVKRSGAVSLRHLTSGYAASVSRQMFGILIAASALRPAGHLHGVVLRD